MPTTSCVICESELRSEIEKRDSTQKPDKVIDWAKKQGVSLSRFSLAKHRANHMENSTPLPEIQPQPVTKACASEPPKPDAEISPPSISDSEFLDLIRDSVYRKFLDGKIRLSLTSGFKAIEIKHKIAEQSQGEKNVVEILQELRKEMLGGKE